MSSNSTELALQVTHKQFEADGICTLVLADPQGRELPAFEAGAHLDVQIDDRLTRQYSLSNDPADRTGYRLAVLREPESRGGSITIHDNVQTGDQLHVSQPRNQFSLAKTAKRHLLFAGGIGITPLLSMAHQLAREQAEFELHYAAKSEAKMAFAGEIRQSGFSDRSYFYLSDGDPAQRFRQQLPNLIPQPEDGVHVYVCGPTGFIEAVMAGFKDHGWPGEQLHTEHFSAAEIDTSNDGSFEVELASSGDVYTVPADQTVFEVLDHAGVFIPTSCEQGVCGTCLTPVIDGIPDHRDVFLDDDEHAANDQFTPCCSRAKSRRLVLDL